MIWCKTVQEIGAASSALVICSIGDLLYQNAVGLSRLQKGNRICFKETDLHFP